MSKMSNIELTDTWFATQKAGTDLLLYLLKKLNRFKDTSLSLRLHYIADSYDKNPTRRWDDCGFSDDKEKCQTHEVVKTVALTSAQALLVKSILEDAKEASFETSKGAFYSCDFCGSPGVVHFGDVSHREDCPAEEILRKFE